MGQDRRVLRAGGRRGRLREQVVGDGDRLLAGGPNRGLEPLQGGKELFAEIRHGTGALFDPRAQGAGDETL